MANEVGVKEAYVYDFKYDMKESNWQAYIAAFSQEEAVAQLYRMIPDKTKIERITATNQYCRLDGLSSPLRDDITLYYREEIEKLKGEINVLKQAKDLTTIPKKK